MKKDHNRRRYPITLLLILTLLTPILLPGGALAASCFGQVGNAACGGPSRGFCVATDICACLQPAWGGNACQTPLFCGVTSCGTTVNALITDKCLPPNGACTQAGPSGYCFCAAGWSGVCCEIVQTDGLLAPASLDFGSVTVGATLPAQILFTFSNPSPTTLTLENITLSGANSADFTITGGSCTPGATVASGGTCSASVAFTPGAPGARSATLAVTTAPGTIPAQAFALTSQLNVPLSTGIESEAIPLVSICDSWRIFTVENGAILLNDPSDGTWSNVGSSMTCNPNDVRSVKILQTSSSNYSTAVNSIISSRYTSYYIDWVRTFKTTTIPDPARIPLARTTLSGSGTIATSSIVIDPITPTTLYAALDGAGVYKSTDNGLNWTTVTTQPVGKRLKALVIKPLDSTTLYAAAYGGGVYVSSNTATPFDSANNGMVWSACATQPANLNLVSLVIDGNGKLYAGTEAGVFVSADGCESWSAMNSGLPQ